MKSEVLFEGVVPTNDEEVRRIEVHKQNGFYYVWISGDMDDSEEWDRDTFEKRYGVWFYETLDNFRNGIAVELNDFWPED